MRVVAAATVSIAFGVATAAGAMAGDFRVAIGKAVFGRLWTQAPASTKNADGLGPLFAARSCAGCHGAGGGRTGFRLGRDDPADHPGLVIRLGDPQGAPDPVYGRQLQPEGVAGVSGEGRAAVRFAAAAGGGRLRPEWRVEAWSYGAPSEDTRASPRVAPSLAGLGLLAHVADVEILSREDPDDRDRDGVSGRAARLSSGEIGRFGWKASEPTLQTQAASAFALDLGLSTPARLVVAGDCTGAQAACLAAPPGTAPGEPEVEPQLMAGLIAFLENRPAPSPPATGQPGARLFSSVGCASCHTPRLALAAGGSAQAFTDLLLHDMGPGLDDGMAEGAAKSPEWRTAPLWGLSRALARGSGLMHDGRAASVAEAVRWHDGEAAGAKNRFEALRPVDRQALLDYVNGL